MIASYNGVADAYAAGSSVGPLTPVNEGGAAKWSASGMPAGLNINAVHGVVAGVFPSGNHHITVSAINTGGQSDFKLALKDRHIQIMT